MLLQIVTSSVLSFRPDTPCFAGSAPPAVDKAYTRLQHAEVTSSAVLCLMSATGSKDSQNINLWRLSMIPAYNSTVFPVY